MHVLVLFPHLACTTQTYQPASRHVHILRSLLHIHTHSHMHTSTHSHMHTSTHSHMHTSTYPHLSTRNSFGECHPRVYCCQSQWVCHADVWGAGLSSTLYHLDKGDRHSGGGHKIYQQGWRSAVVVCVCVCVCVCVHVCECMFTVPNLQIAHMCYEISRLRKFSYFTEHIFPVVFTAENDGPYVIRTRLIFRSIRNRDIGTYHCAASNRAGSASGTTTIKLIGELYNDRLSTCC